MEIILQLLGEFLLQVIGEALFEMGFHALGEPFRTPPKPWIASIGYALFGAIFGGLSLIFLPAHLIKLGIFRTLNVMLTPLVMGGVMACFGLWRRGRGDPVFRIDRFSYGFLFALVFALVRYRFAH